LTGPLPSRALLNQMNSSAWPHDITQGRPSFADQMPRIRGEPSTRKPSWQPTGPRTFRRRPTTKATKYRDEERMAA